MYIYICIVVAIDITWLSMAVHSVHWKSKRNWLQGSELQSIVKTMFFLFFLVGDVRKHCKNNGLFGFFGFQETLEREQDPRSPLQESPENEKNKKNIVFIRCSAICVANHCKNNVFLGFSGR